MEWSSFIAPGVVGGLLGLYLKSIGQRIDDLKTSTAQQFEVIDKRFDETSKRFDETSKRFDETSRRLDALQIEVTSLGKGVARIEGRLDPYDRTTSSPHSVKEERMKTASPPSSQEPPGQGQ